MELLQWECHLSLSFWPFPVVAAQSAVAGKKEWGEKQETGVCLQLPLSHLNKRTFFFRGREAVNTFPNKR